MQVLPHGLLLLAGLLGLAEIAASPQTSAHSTERVLAIQHLGKGVASLDGPWQFHLGDNPAWALPETGDESRHAGWEEIRADKTWGAQGHPAYTGFAWYRKQIHLEPAEGAAAEFALLIERIDDAYEIYWNGTLIGRNGKLPPKPVRYLSQPAQTFGLGRARDGVLAVRVWKAPLISLDSDRRGGFHSVPIIGSPTGIAAFKDTLDYRWLRSRQYTFGLESLYGLVMFLSLLGWLRNRSQHILFWMFAFNGASVVALLLTGLRIPLPHSIALGLLQPVMSTLDIGLWFLLLYLLQLEDNDTLAHLTRTMAIISISAAVLDGMLMLLDWTDPALTSRLQLADAALTAVFTTAEAYPLVLVAFAVRKQLDSARWLVAISALASQMISVIRTAVQQGNRFTHWTIGDKIGGPLFSVNGNLFTAQTIADTLLLLAIIYAVYRYIQESTLRRATLEEEFTSARELQHVLIPEALPSLPGFAFTSAYRPALEVGGDFFQVIPLEGDHAGSTLILLGDVSGKGLKAAMTVSLIVGAVRTLARFAPYPAEMLSELNLRLCGRMQDGFVTCLALRLGPDGHCVIASAGHPDPFLNKHPVSLPCALPLGIVASAEFEEAEVELREGDHFALYTDGLLEARSASGELFSFERLSELFATRPDATRATEAAVNFGQQDDITVLILTRLGRDEASFSRLSAPQWVRS